MAMDTRIAEASRDAQYDSHSDGGEAAYCQARESIPRSLEPAPYLLTSIARSYKTRGCRTPSVQLTRLEA